MLPTIDYENWLPITKGVQKELDRLDQLPKGAVKAAQLELYSSIALEFRHFREAYRNHVTHSRTHYDEREAVRVFEHVRSFMQELATAGVI